MALNKLVTKTALFTELAPLGLAVVGADVVEFDEGVVEFDEDVVEGGERVVEFDEVSGSVSKIASSFFNNSL